MQKIISYLNFDGNCREAMQFYKQQLGGELSVMNFDEAHCGPGSGNRVMHSRLTMDGAPFLMASDTLPGMQFVQGTNFSISVACDSRDQLDRLYAGLSEGGKSTMPPADMFWGDYFGMLTDKFGVHWMLDQEAVRTA